MNYNDTPAYIVSSAKGSTETDFTSATFRASILTHAKTGPSAKEMAIPRIESIKKVIQAHAKDAGIETDRLQTTFAVDVHKNRATGDFDGYQATYTIEFKGKNVAHATALHDALTSIEGVQAPTPVFNLDDSLEVHTRAFKDASDRARAKFVRQCQAIGQDPLAFFVSSWRIEERHVSGKFVALGGDPGGDSKTITIAPGKARHELEVVLVYTRTQPAP